MKGGDEASSPDYTPTMQLIFDRGDSQRPRGHALIYFRNAAASGSLLATYVVIPPITIDFSKYLPPMFAGQAMAGNLAEASAVVPLPPVPESIASIQVLQALAERRDDDLILAGDATADQIEQLLMYTNEAAQLYYHLYTDFTRHLPEVPVDELIEEHTADGPSSEELSYALMGERERLGELAKMAGLLRYALDGNDKRLADETLATMQLLAKHLQPKYWGDKVVAATSTPGERGGHLSQLYIDRCYKLLDEDYAAVGSIEHEIEQLASTQ